MMEVADTRAAGVLRRKSWQRAFAVRLFASDVLVVVASVFTSQFVWFGFDKVPVAAKTPVDLTSGYTLVSVVLIVSWMLLLDAFATRDHKVIGSGTLEYKRVADATIRLFGLFAIVAFLFQIDLSRGYFLTALPFGMLLLIANTLALAPVAPCPVKPRVL